jgi:hypothetical protein
LHLTCVQPVLPPQANSSSTASSAAAASSKSITRCGGGGVSLAGSRVGRKSESAGRPTVHNSSSARDCPGVIVIASGRRPRDTPPFSTAPLLLRGNCLLCPGKSQKGRCLTARHACSILYHDVPSPNLTTRNFFIAVPPAEAAQALRHPTTHCAHTGRRLAEGS